MALTDLEVKILSLLDQRFWETGYVVSNDKVSADLRCSEQAVKKAWSKPEFRQALIARGVDLSPGESKDILTPTQVILANLLLNAHDKRSVREKCELVDVSSQQYNAWMRQTSFSGYLRKRAESAFAATDSVAYTALSNLVENGDFNGIKLFFEMRGIYNPKMQVEVNVELVVVRLIEIVARHVTDPLVLQAIAAEIETIELGPGTGAVGNAINSYSEVSL
jgi:hypothetical protein